jgi:hypothetical protein
MARKQLPDQMVAIIGAAHSIVGIPAWQTELVLGHLTQSMHDAADELERTDVVARQQASANLAATLQQKFDLDPAGARAFAEAAVSGPVALSKFVEERAAEAPRPAPESPAMPTTPTTPSGTQSGADLERRIAEFHADAEKVRAIGDPLHPMHHHFKQDRQDLINALAEQQRATAVAAAAPPAANVRATTPTQPNVSRGRAALEKAKAMDRDEGTRAILSNPRHADYDATRATRQSLIAEAAQAGETEL